MNGLPYPWSSLVLEGDEGLHLVNFQTNLTNVHQELPLLFWHFLNTTPYHLSWYKPPSLISCRANLKFVCNPKFTNFDQTKMLRLDWANFQRKQCPAGFVLWLQSFLYILKKSLTKKCFAIFPLSLSLILFDIIIFEVQKLDSGFGPIQRREDDSAKYLKNWIWIRAFQMGKGDFKNFLSPKCKLNFASFSFLFVL